MSKKAFEGIKKGLEEAIAYSNGDESAVHRTVKV